jgi:hypothetical protein
VPADSGSEAEDQVRLARGYNNSIYLMVAIPYLAVGTVGYLVYRQLRLRAAWQQHQLESARALPPGDPLPPRPGDGTCSPTSPDDGS